VADARRVPRMQGFIAGRPVELQAAQGGTLSSLPELPAQIDADSTAGYIRRVLAGDSPVPAPIALQVAQILRLVAAM